MNKFRFYYFLSSALSLTIIIISIFNIKDLFEDIFKIRKQYDINKCLPFLIWKFTLIFNIFFFFASFGFLGYLIFKRNTNYDRVIYIKIGPTIDIIILIFLILSSLVFGPLLSVEVILMLLFYGQIMQGCEYSSKDPYKIFYFPYITLASFLSLLMTAVLGLIVSRRCSRRRLMQRRNISNIGELINII
jgi:hypothetical protein